MSDGFFVQREEERSEEKYERTKKNSGLESFLAFPLNVFFVVRSNEKQKSLHENFFFA